MYGEYMERKRRGEMIVLKLSTKVASWCKPEVLKKTRENLEIGSPV